MIDGSLTRGWETKGVTGQFVRISLGGGGLYRITDIFIDPAATQGDTPDADLRNFRFSVSTDGTTFTTVLTGQTQENNSLQKFHLSSPVNARQVKLELLDNYGNPNRIAVAELQVYGSPAQTGSAHLRNASRLELKSDAKSSALATVRYILHGVSVKPPKKRIGRGKLHEPLYSRYVVQTSKRQKVSLGFRDGSVLHVNSLTTLALVSGAVTRDKKGEVQVIVKPGTKQSVQTASATASALGTKYDVIARGKTTIVVVIEGVVLVQNNKGSVLVKTGDETTVKVGHKPTQPSVASNSLTSAKWAKNIPTPDLGTNVALDFNGGDILKASS